MAKTTIWLIEDAVLIGIPGEEYYRAIAESDDHTKRYDVEWDILDDFDLCHDENEENACDWDNPRAIIEWETGEYLDVKNCVCKGPDRVNQHISEN